MSHLRPKERQIYTEIFEKIDVDGSGNLCMAEVGCLCDELGFSFDAAQIKDVFGQLDTDKSGTVTLEEFLSVMQPIKRSEKRCATLRRMFKKADKNKDGVLTADELQHALASSAEDGRGELDKIEVEKLIALADVNGDGKLNYEEFLALLKPVIESQNN